MQVDIFSEFSSHPTLGTVVELGKVLEVVIRLRDINWRRTFGQQRLIPRS